MALDRFKLMNPQRDRFKPLNLIAQAADRTLYRSSSGPHFSGAAVKEKIPVASGNAEFLAHGDPSSPGTVNATGAIGYRRCILVFDSSMNCS